MIGGIFRELIPHAPGTSARRIGGSGYVAALTAAALGADVSLVSFVGKEDSESAFAALDRAGVNSSGVQVVEGASGIFAFEDIVDRRPPRPSYRPAEILPTAEAPEGIATSAVVLAFGFPDFDCLPWVQAALQDGGALLWDRQGWLSRDLPRLALEELPASRKVYIANLQEMLEATNRATYAQGLEEQPAAGFDTSVIKCGRWGTIVTPKVDDTTPDGGATVLVPAFIAKARSVIGSGDAFAGALAAEVAANTEVGVAAWTGAAAASLFVERDGNVPPRALTAAVASVLAERPRRFVSPVALERVKVYLAGPWFSAAEAMVITELEASLENLGVTVLSPRRDVGELTPQSTEQRVREVGQQDFAGIDSSDLLVAVLDGDDPGTLIEVGYAAKAGIATIALASRPEAMAQPMRAAAGVRVARSISGLLDEVTAWARKNRGIG